MSALSSLTSVTTLAGGDLVPLFSQSQGGDRSVPLSVLTTYIKGPTAAATQTQYAAPNATGMTVTIAPTTAGGSVDLILTPVADYAAMTIVLPTPPTDRQRVNVTTTHAVTTLTVSAAGLAVNGAPTSIAINGFFSMRYDQITNSWYRVS